VSTVAVPAARAVRRSVLRWIAWSAIAVAGVGLWLMLPPVAIRSALFIFLVEGLAAVTCAAVAGMGERRLG